MCLPAGATAEATKFTGEVTVAPLPGDVIVTPFTVVLPLVLEVDVVVVGVVDVEVVVVGGGVEVEVVVVGGVEVVEVVPTVIDIELLKASPAVFQPTTLRVWLPVLRVTKVSRLACCTV